MKKLIPILLAALSVLGAERASAARYQGTVVSVYAYQTLIYVVVTDGNFDGASSTCRTASGMVFSFSPNDAYGRSLLAIALTAKTTGQLVYAIGNGTCVASSPYGGGHGETLTGMDLKGT